MIQLTLKKVATGVILCMWLAVRSDGKARSNGPPAGSLVEEVLSASHALSGVSWEAAGDSLSCTFKNLPPLKVDEKTAEEIFTKGILYGRIVRDTLDHPFVLLPLIHIGPGGPTVEEVKEFNELSGDSVLVYHYKVYDDAGDGQVMVILAEARDRAEIPLDVKVVDSTWEEGPDMQISTIHAQLRPFANAFDAVNRAYVAHLKEHLKKRLTPAEKSELTKLVKTLEAEYWKYTLSVVKEERRDAAKALFHAYIQALRWDKNRH